MRNFIDIITEAATRRDPRFQFHLSVEPALKPLVAFSDQSRTISVDGERGQAGGEGIYTTLSLSYWIAQLAYEVGVSPRYCYLVWVEGADNPTSIWSAHQEVSSPEEVIVITLLGDLGDGDEMPDVGRYEWLADRWVQAHPSFIPDMTGEV